ncbi:VWA domain-containing protein [Mucilaginibacter pallidiroseus]|uniref:VWA domain-containing protein n=1 Tax=Mucilaginibacter pallidiroseus TaxID=2599295 RepID=A0A563UD90_9SPHI|nr:VWA domain-containing protein [Mucilaginibacter pallidiroseus]TWR29325.1 VWA domain-containing protein [Mucilaginibacter pallidiroseus]
MSVTLGSVSVWWLPVCLLAGLLYAWLMYWQPVTLSKHLRYGLFALRALAVTLLAVLLLSPLIKSTSYQPQKPLVLVAQDNSQSINLFSAKGDIAGVNMGLKGLKAKLGDDYDVRFFTFDKLLNEGDLVNYKGSQTNIAGALQQLNSRFANQNIGALILATDGLSNLGSDPQYEAPNLKTSIYTIALGDTTPRRDLLIGNISYNKTAFLGNDFEVELLAEAYQSKGEQMRLTITEDGAQVSAQSIAITSGAFKKVIPLKLNADKKGIRKFTFSLAPLANELSVQNNTEAIYIEVLDASQKVLLVYDSPHPDIGVIKQGISANRNFEVKAVQADELGNVAPADYSMLILYQLSANSYNKVKQLTAGRTPIWFVGGTQADAQALNAAQNTVKLPAGGGQETQEVFAQPVPSFAAFTLTDSTLNKISKLPPLLATYGTYTANASSALLLKQRIGNVATNYPLLAFSDEGGRRIAVLAAQGLWRWQLAEYREFGSHAAVNELLSQTVQYLTVNSNRQRFRVYPSKNVFDEGENVLLNAELYNEALELVNTPDVKIDLKNNAGKNFSFLFTRSGQSYQLNAAALPVGDYTYQAITSLGKQQFKASGRLTVKQLNLEARQSTANHTLLKSIADKSGGQILLPSQIGKLADLIRKNDNIKTVVYEDKKYNDLVDLKWIFAVLMVLLTTEWFLRKREGQI